MIRIRVVEFLICLLIIFIVGYSIRISIGMENRVLFAFLLNIGAGLSTCIGGLLIFSKRLIYLARPTRLGIALGMSAGVMIFISLVEIFQESIKKFEHGLSGLVEESSCKDKCQGNRTNEREENCLKKCEGHAWLFASLCFLLGTIIIYLLDIIVHKISPNAETEPELYIEEFEALQNSMKNINESQQNNHFQETNQIREQRKDNGLSEHARKQLNRTGILTAIAIGIHNLPEGIGTYLGAIENTRLGYALAIGIALHNIPEGVAVAIPVYFATGSRVKAFLWTLISALAEPAGGFLCWLITRHKNKDQRDQQSQPYLEGIIFGLIAGVMVTISFKELLPTAYRYCSHSSRVTFSVLIGMAIMAISLILFAYAGV